MFNPITAYFRSPEGRQFAREEKPSDDMGLDMWLKFKEEIKWARATLKRSDAVTWYLRLARIAIVEDNLRSMPGANALRTKLYADAGFANQPGHFIELNVLKRELKHFFGLPIPAIRKYRFQRDEPRKVLARWKKIEDEWKATRVQLVDPHDDDTILYDFNDGWSWVNLNSGACDDEANAMGHCGNRFGNSGDTLLSLRKRQPDGSWRPSLTFVLDRNGFLGEMKGRANEKPAQKYHKMITALLLLPEVKGIKGGGHDPANNFDISDLTQAEQDYLYDQKPELMPLPKILELHGPTKLFRDQCIEKLRDLNPDWINFYKRDWHEVDGEWRFVYDTADYWTEFLKNTKYVDESVVSLAKYYAGEDRDYFYHGSSQPIREWVDSALPQAYINSLMDYVWNQCEDDIKDYLEEPELTREELREREVWDFLEDVEEPPEICEALGTALARGETGGYTDNIHEALKKCLQEWHYFHCGQADGKWQLYLTPQGVAELLTEGTESIENDEIETDKPTVDEDADYAGWSKEEALEGYREVAPTEALPQVPAFRPVEDLSDEEVAKEYHDLTGNDISRYSYDAPSARSILRGARERRYGKLENN